jgi:hypothetical protein
MTVVLRDGPYRVFIYVDEPDEPPHVHVKRDDDQAKFWIHPVVVAWSRRFKPIELRRIARMLEANEAKLIKEWHARHGSRVSARPSDQDDPGR